MQNKNYRLLKDLPFAKAGEIFESRILDDGKEYMFWGEIKIQNIKNFDEWFEETPKCYFSINKYKKEVQKVSVKYHPNWVIKNIKSLGLLFETEEEAEKYLEYLKAKEIIKQDTKGFKPEWNNNGKGRYCGSWDFDDNKPNWKYGLNTPKEPNIYFKSRKDILESFEKHLTEWKTYLTYEQ